ncbi:alpha/beta hydrolase [Pacificitalea manganoxidans]|uniref:Alpha/beta hydrolase n=1 Tax=Pacificitalea manganoxidans TaxID=1411902 RepID=A0A291M1J6_9RHOB|nr:alpha/beta hydrolase [Pacificitalea manganoxidans]ATI42829.1 alpha/beta hydrolase [Pacificitalea manganoxidans]MDR6307262.1 pimeloyl-ACP methyl ester carboxylesterase [Pacificitalea manganoxidans]
MSRFTASDGASLAFDDTGTGPAGSGVPLLCLAGLTRNARDFEPLLPHLGARRVIRMDYRGRGRSDYTGAATYTVPQEARDVLDLLDHLGLDRVALLGTSRGGLIGMGLAAVAGDRLAGLCLNDVGPRIERAGLERISGYIGRNPAARTHEELAAQLAQVMTGFANVPPERWLQQARAQYLRTDDGLQIDYDPALRDSFTAAFSGDLPEAWAQFDAAADLPLCTLRGVNSELLSEATLQKMQARRPDMIVARVPDRGHVPFLDEPEALVAIQTWLEACDG